jgi:hypothetical protein
VRLPAHVIARRRCASSFLFVSVVDGFHHVVGTLHVTATHVVGPDWAMFITVIISTLLLALPIAGVSIGTLA